jgi:hypothetical protein
MVRPACKESLKHTDSDNGQMYHVGCRVVKKSCCRVEIVMMHHRLFRLKILSRRKGCKRKLILDSTVHRPTRRHGTTARLASTARNVIISSTGAAFKTLLDSSIKGDVHYYITATTSTTGRTTVPPRAIMVVEVHIVLVSVRQTRHTHTNSQNAG